MDIKRENQILNAIAVKYLKKMWWTSKHLDFIENANETAHRMFYLLYKYLTDHKLYSNKLSGFSANNCNANFKKHNSLFTFVKDQNPNILKVNCYAYIVHNVGNYSKDQVIYEVGSLV